MSAAGLFLAVTGCATLPKNVRRDIVEVSTFYNSQNLWLNFEDPPTNVPQGLRFSLFLKAAGQDLGVFGDGIIHVDMYRIERDEEGEATRTHVKKWSLDTEEAAAYRSTRTTAFGHGYGMRLNWGDADVRGHEIQLVVSFERRDGPVIRGRPWYVKVPERVRGRTP